MIINVSLGYVLSADVVEESLFCEVLLVIHRRLMTRQYAPLRWIFPSVKWTTVNIMKVIQLKLSIWLLMLQCPDLCWQMVYQISMFSGGGVGRSLGFHWLDLSALWRLLALSGCLISFLHMHKEKTMAQTVGQIPQLSSPHKIGA